MKMEGGWAWFTSSSDIFTDYSSDSDSRKLVNICIPTDAYSCIMGSYLIFMLLQMFMLMTLTVVFVLTHFRVDSIQSKLAVLDKSHC